MISILEAEVEEIYVEKLLLEDGTIITSAN